MGKNPVILNDMAQSVYFCRINFIFMQNTLTVYKKKNNFSGRLRSEAKLEIVICPLSLL